jgi:hypothetical protein
MRADIAPDSIDEAKRTVELIWTTGEKGLRSPWFSEPYYEELSLDPAHVRMKRMESGNCPLLAVHDQSSLDAVIGVIERGWLVRTKRDAASCASRMTRSPSAPGRKSKARF